MRRLCVPPRKLKPLFDAFTDDLEPGHVLGSRSSGVLRSGADAEGLLSIDHERLRVGSQAAPGWGRAGISYGPFADRAGLTFVVQVLNAHNGAQDHPSRNLVRLIGRWIIGSGTEGMTTRLKGLAGHRDRETVRHRLSRFARLDRRAAGATTRAENLAIGWFDSPCPKSIPAHGSVIVAGDPVHSGELRVGGTGISRPRLGELPLTVVGVSSGRGSVYYAAVWPIDSDSEGLHLLPLGMIDTAIADPSWVGLQQRRNSEIGFRADTLVDSVAIADVDDWARWWTTAHLADRFLGDEDPAAESRPEHAFEASNWIGSGGDLRRTPDGLRTGTGDGFIGVEPGAPSGLIGFRITTGAAGGCSFRWRSGDSGHWELLLRSDDWLIRVVDSDEVRSSWTGSLTNKAVYRVLIVDDGLNVTVLIDGTPILSHFPAAEAAGSESGFVIGVLGPGWALTDFEAHPRKLRVPAGLGVVLPQRQVVGNEQWTESFVGLGGDLDGWRGAPGTWRRRLGVDRFAGADEGVAVVASVDEPAKGRSAFTVPWIDPAGVHLTAEIVPPGKARGQGHRGRGGIVLWQDEANYVMVNTWLDDGFDGSSVSVFFHLDGYEDVFDAVWVNVGEGISHGTAYELGVGYLDGELVVEVDGAPVLYRRLTDIDPDARTLQVVEVGLLANWEWGTDTGTSFRRLTARRVGRAGV